ncbi:uncharacterized protein LOC103519088 [Diaphorina citri]|uniref:Protein CUSTOS n=1 Tax=Diaphorina citri TaxID=121845 RepID=A0A1S3DI82_DIACI|nr:uncharacterized protein LOC103519088 [Diaphorina citri]
MSDDSSSDEDVSKFQEAVDIKLTEAFSKNTPSANNHDSWEAAKNDLPSLRRTKEEDNFSSNHLSIQVTPEFQKFVAKKLETSLDRYLNEYLSENSETEKDHVNSNKKLKKASKSTSGIKLFKSSSDLIGEFKEDTHDTDEKIRKHNQTNKINKKRNGHDYNEKEEMKKFKAVVVEPDVILSRSETQAWSKQVKGEVIKVERTNANNKVYSIKHEGYIPPESWNGRIVR